MRTFLKTAMATVCLAGVLVVTGATGAEARVKGPRLDSLSYACGALQDEADKLIAEIGNASLERRAEIIARAREIAVMWNDHCRRTFGDIVLRYPSRFVAVRDTLNPDSVGPVNHTHPAPRWDPKVLTPDKAVKVLEAETSEESEPAPATDDTSTVEAPTTTPATTPTTAPLAERARPKVRELLSHSPAF